MIGDALSKGLVFVDHFVGRAHGAVAGDLMGVVKLASEKGKNVDDGMGLLLEQHHQVGAVDFDACGFFGSGRFGLMGRLLKHGGEAEILAGTGLVEQDFLVIFVDDDDADGTGDHDVGALGGISHAEDSLPGENCLSSTCPARMRSSSSSRLEKRGISRSTSGEQAMEFSLLRFSCQKSKANGRVVRRQPRIYRDFHGKGFFRVRHILTGKSRSFDCVLARSATKRIEEK